MLEKIIKAFEKVPYNVLWKFEKDELLGKPKNVMIKKWLPQQDVLGMFSKGFIVSMLKCN